MALVFDSVVADGTQAPQILLFGGTLNPCTVQNIANALNAANSFAGRLGCLPSAFTYLPNQQRFDPTPNTPSVWINQNYLAARPAAGAAVRASLSASPRPPTSSIGYSNQANLGIEHRVRQQLHGVVAVQLQRRASPQPAHQLECRARPILDSELVQRHDRSERDASPKGCVLQQPAVGQRRRS